MPLSSSFPAATQRRILSLVVAMTVATAASGTVVGQTEETLTPFVEKYCRDCHNSKEAEARLDLTAFQSNREIGDDFRTWQNVIRRLDAGEMPPADATPRPTAEQSRAFVAEVRGILKAEALRKAGDPGIVPVRRLSNAEYNYTIRDLVGVDLRPTREFPVDPANEAGFDNSAESLSLSPALLNKYLGAAREVVQHLVLKPDGFTIAPHPVVTDTDRDKYCVNRIVEFYSRQPTDYADYFFAAWQVRNTNESAPDILPRIAEMQKVSPKYLTTIFDVLTDETLAFGPIGQLQAMWNALPADATLQQESRAGCQQMADLVVTLRRRLEPEVEGLVLSGIHSGAQAFVLWKNDQYAANRRRFSEKALIEPLDTPVETREDRALLLPASDAERPQFLTAMSRFADVFPDAFYLSERGRDYVGVPREKQEKGRLLSAGFHSMMGYYRDDAPLCDLILSEDEKHELDVLWQELDFIASAPMRQYTSFVWFERTDSAFLRDAEFDFARAEDHNVTSEDMIHRLAEAYLAKAARNGGSPEPMRAIETFFATMNRQIRWVEQARRDAEPSHLQKLEEFAARSYRRPLTMEEKQELRTFYQRLRDEDGLTHEEAIQDSVVSLLMSPLFFFRTDLAGSLAPSSGATNSAITDSSIPCESLADDELASRLSYFLWSSMPDEQLLQQAAAGQLHTPEILLRETRRMLQDDRVRALAVEAAGNWLDFRRFEEHNSVDRERFPQFTDELRAAMFQEPVRFLEDLIRNDSSVLDCLYANHTFVNAPLAKHYGIELPTNNLPPDPDSWIRIADAGKYGRGGLIPMSVFLTQNSPGLRTSPVKRGYWVVRRLLGEQIPPPPPNVPDLPEDESALGELTLREALAKHRQHASCAGCHDRFDSVGLIFENFGPVGELRTVDLGERLVDTRATFPDGTEGHNLEDLRRYLRQNREREFLDTVCRKLLSFGLGRTLQLSDDLLVDEMVAKQQDGTGRFSDLIVQIVTSPQFLTRRR